MTVTVTFEGESHADIVEQVKAWLATTEGPDHLTPAEAIGPIRRWVILGVLTSSVALYAMTVTIASVALPKMQGTLSATQDQIAWVITFNIVATAVATPLAGWLAGRFGRRNVMLVIAALESALAAQGSPAKPGAGPSAAQAVYGSRG